MKAIICKLFGHRPVEGELRRSPYTVYTHSRDTTCDRCGKHLGREHLYIDALLRPDLF